VGESKHGVIAGYAIILFRKTDAIAHPVRDLEAGSFIQLLIFLLIHLYWTTTLSRITYATLLIGQQAEV
jgi:hypothetical protein